ncbi:hypothetical protein [Acrocarpospora catenulata]|nr:hypothetical protein [Acrocarpospora catenulata]
MLRNVNRNKTGTERPGIKTDAGPFCAGGAADSASAIVSSLPAEPVAAL